MMSKEEKEFVKEMKAIFLKHKALGSLRLAQLMQYAFSKAIEQYAYKAPVTKVKTHE